MEGVSIGGSIICSAAMACSSICQVKEGKVEIKGQFFNDLGWSVYEELASLIYAESDSDSFFLSFFLLK